MKRIISCPTLMFCWSVTPEVLILCTMLWFWSTDCRHRQHHLREHGPGPGSCFQSDPAGGRARPAGSCPVWSRRGHAAVRRRHHHRRLQPHVSKGLSCCLPFLGRWSRSGRGGEDFNSKTFEMMTFYFSHSSPETSCQLSTVEDTPKAIFHWRCRFWASNTHCRGLLL